MTASHEVDTMLDTHSIFMGLDPMITASAILAIIYVFIIVDKINATVVALLGATVMVLLGILNQDMAYEGIDFNTIFLLIGMMAIVGITKKNRCIPIYCNFDG